MQTEERLLATMPLHAITTIYGEEGLRRRLALEVQDFPELERQRIHRALDIAAAVHAADRRQREPYLNHLLRVALRIIHHYRVRDPDVVCAALLHDAVEDHHDAIAPGGDQRAALGVLAGEFGQRVADLVAAVTNPPVIPGRDRHRQYQEHVAASLDRCPWARIIKVSDFTDNGVGLIHTTGPRVAALAGKYAPLVPVLRELVDRSDTPLDGDVKDRIRRQLDRAAERFSAVLAPQTADSCTSATGLSVILLRRGTRPRCAAAAGRR